VQEIVAITNKITYDTCFWNPARSTKPQNFKAAAPATTALDPLLLGKTCDFCDWKTLTAMDTFGRIEGPHAVSASNLFKYNGPHQGVIMFKHHPPLTFSLEQTCDLLDVAAGWFKAAAAAAEKEGYSSADLHPMLVWNCLHRAGASQYHGHAQTMLSAVPFPQLQRDADVAARYTAGYESHHQLAHADVGLSCSYGDAVAFASICPAHDAEIVILGDHLGSRAFQSLVHCAVRALVDELGISTFNAGIYGVGMGISDTVTRDGMRKTGHQVKARVVGRGRLDSAASDVGGLEVFGGASIGHTDPWVVMRALDRVRAATLLPIDLGRPATNGTF
jgi:hypothetical protein